MNSFKQALVAFALVATAAFSDIVVKPDGSVTCTGGCSGSINPTTGTVTVCQGSTCVTIGGSGGSHPGSSQHK